jgi:hypothetical protein
MENLEKEATGYRGTIAGLKQDLKKANFRNFDSDHI